MAVYKFEVGKYYRWVGENHSHVTINDDMRIMLDGNPRRCIKIQEFENEALFEGMTRYDRSRGDVGCWYWPLENFECVVMNGAYIRLGSSEQDTYLAQQLIGKLVYYTDLADDFNLHGAIQEKRLIEIEAGTPFPYLIGCRWRYIWAKNSDLNPAYESFINNFSGIAKIPKGYLIEPWGQCDGSSKITHTKHTALGNITVPHIDNVKIGTPIRKHSGLDHL